MNPEINQDKDNLVEETTAKSVVKQKQVLTKKTATKNEF